MKGILFYYSNTGNTKIVCDYIRRTVKSAELTLCNILKDPIPDLTEFDITGFATWADFWAPSKLFRDFIKNLPSQNSKNAFIVCTYGFKYGRTLKQTYTELTKKGFSVFDAHALHTPENVATMICSGMAMEHAPNDKELSSFKQFVINLDTKIGSLQSGRKTTPHKLPLWHNLMPAMPRFLGKLTMGNKFVDNALCIKCELCKAVCPVNAISLSNFPVFAENECAHCWACFNRCPKKAIYTKKFRGKGHYPKPIAQFVDKFS